MPERGSRTGPRLKQGAGAALSPFLAMEVVARANAAERERAANAPRVLRLEVGQPGTGAPEAAIRAAERALRNGGALGYTEALGLPDLRARIAAHYRDRYGLDVVASRIAVSTGASGGFLLAFLAAFDPGDRIATVRPFYPPYDNILRALGMRPVLLDPPPSGAPGARFQPTVAALEALGDTPAGLPDGLVVASPGNPAGTCLTPDELAALCRFCDGHGIRMISDEIYHGLDWSGPPRSAAEFSDSAVVVNSFSKYWSMTGWRVGWVVLPEDLRAPVLRLKQNLFISAPHVSQVAAEAAFDAGAELDENVRRYRRSRDVLLDGLHRGGFGPVAPPDGAFYLWARLPGAETSAAYCDRLLRDAAVAATPGIDFDPVDGSQFVRFSYCGAEADIAEAAERVAAFPPG